jgi:hypothetical protein
MSLNIGTSACEAARRLNSNADWHLVLDGVAEQVRATMNRALDAAPENAQVALGYARALRDVYLALESATKEIPLQRVERPTPVKGRKE